MEIKNIIIVLLLIVFKLEANAQNKILQPLDPKDPIGPSIPVKPIEPIKIGEFDIDRELISRNSSSTCDCGENISFEYNNFFHSVQLMERAMRAQRQAWLRTQENLINEEIERAFNTDFPNYTEARKHLIKHQESKAVDNYNNGVNPVRRKYAVKVDRKLTYQDDLLKEIKLLNFREDELRRGITNSKYGHLKLGATPINNLNLNTILNEKNTRLSSFISNNVAYKKETNIYNELIKIDALYAGNTNHGIFDLLMNKQNQYFSQYNDWERLNLTYVYLLDYLHPIRIPGIPHSITVNNKTLVRELFGSSDFLEHLAINNYGGNPSADNVDPLLNAISIDNMLADTAVKNLGQRNVEFLKSRPKLKYEIMEYFKVNDFSKISHDCVNYLLNQLQDGNSFAPNTNLYQSSGAALLQNLSNPNRVLEINLNDQAIREGFTNFANVLSELFSDG